MKFNNKKYKKILMYLLAKSLNKSYIGKTVICTTLYFINFNYYEQYGKYLTKESYFKSKNGIEPNHFNEVINEFVAKKELQVRYEPYYHRTIHKYYIAKIPNANFT